MSDTWKIAIIEGSMVLIGVLLALFVDSWREDREFQQRVDLTEAQIIEEIGNNRDRMVSYREDFVRRHEQLTAWGAGLDSGKGILDQFDGFPGVPSTFMNQSAWSMANNSQVTEFLDYAFYDAAFALYAAGEVTESRLRIVLELVFNVQGFDATYTEPILGVLKLYFQDIISNLDDSIAAHDRFLETYGQVQ